jgi:hypothetical protein
MSVGQTSQFQPDARVQAECDCGWDWRGPGQAWPWISDQHALAHQKGRDGLPATGRMLAHEAEADPAPEAEAEASI